MTAQQQVELAPHSIEAEEAVLGSLLLNPDVLPDVNLKPNDFFILRNAWVYEAAIQSFREHGTIDNLTIIEQLKKKGRLEEIGGGAYVTYLINGTPTSLHADVYAEIVHQAAVRRELLSAATRIAQLATGSDNNIDEAITESSSALQAVADYRAGRNTVVDTNDDYVARRRDGRTNGRQAEVIPTPWDVFNAPDYEYLFARGRTTGIVAPTGTGKTTFATEMVYDVVMNSGIPVLYITMESTPDNIRDKFMARMLRTTTKYITGTITESFRPSNPDCKNDVFEGCRNGDPLQQSQCGCYKHYEFEKYLTLAEETFAKAPLFVVGGAGFTPEKAIAVARHYKRLYPNLGMVVIDHFYQFRKPPNVQNLNVFETNAIRTIVEAAQELNVSMFVMLQQRKTESNAIYEKPPTIQQIRGASEIPENFDAIISFAMKAVKDVATGNKVPGNEGTAVVLKLRGADNLRAFKIKAVRPQSRFELS